VKRLGFRAVGRKYGVSDNAIRKWVRFYENERARVEAEADELDEAA
jgi:transposase-like protein